MALDAPTIPIQSFENDRELFAFRKLYVKVNRYPTPLGNRSKRANDSLGHGAAPVFAATDRRNVFAVKTYKKDTRGTLPRSHFD